MWTTTWAAAVRKGQEPLTWGRVDGRCVGPNGPSPPRPRFSWRRRDAGRDSVSQRAPRLTDTPTSGGGPPPGFQLARQGGGLSGRQGGARWVPGVPGRAGCVCATPGACARTVVTCGGRRARGPAAWDRRRGKASTAQSPERAAAGARGPRSLSLALSGEGRAQGVASHPGARGERRPRGLRTEVSVTGGPAGGRGRIHPLRVRGEWGLGQEASRGPSAGEWRPWAPGLLDGGIQRLGNSTREHQSAVQDHCNRKPPCFRAPREKKRPLPTRDSP